MHTTSVHSCKHLRPKLQTAPYRACCKPGAGARLVAHLRRACAPAFAKPAHAHHSSAPPLPGRCPIAAASTTPAPARAHQPPQQQQGPTATPRPRSPPGPASPRPGPPPVPPPAGGDPRHASTMDAAEVARQRAEARRQKLLARGKDRLTSITGLYAAPEPGGTGWARRRGGWPPQRAAPAR